MISAIICKQTSRFLDFQSQFVNFEILISAIGKLCIAKSLGSMVLSQKNDS